MDWHGQKLNSPDKLQSINLSFENQVINVLDETYSKLETVLPLRAHFTKYVLIIYRYSLMEFLWQRLNRLESSGDYT
jgi:hypothetical protein